MTKLIAVSLIMMMCVGGSDATSQTRWTVGGNAGISIFDGSAGFHFGPMAEASLSKNLAIGTEFTINTHTGTPILWWNQVKYYFDVQGSNLEPYADGGFVLDFMTGGPYFGLLFGGGVNIPVDGRLSISPELQMGPIFSVGGGRISTPFGSFDVEGTTIFTVLMRAGIRYEL